MAGRSLHRWIFAGLVLGALLGLGLSALGARAEGLLWLLDLLGRTVFVGALKMVVAPLVFFSILTSVASLPGAALLRLGRRTLLYFLATTGVAAALGLGLVHALQPGYGPERESIRAAWQVESPSGESERAERLRAAAGRSPGEIVKGDIERVLQNPFAALARGESLGIITFALLLGAALVAVGEAGRPAVEVVAALNAAIFRLTGWIMAGSPFFVFCLVASLVGRLGTEVFRTLGAYVGTVLLGIGLHTLFLLALLPLLGRMPLGRFFRGFREAWVLAFTTRSSAATLPVSLRAVQSLGVPRAVADFVLPLGATVNMNGTALYEGVAVIYLVQLFGGLPGAEISLTPLSTLLVFLTAVLASVGAAAVPDAGLVTMVLVAEAVGLSVDYIPLIFAVDAFLDMFRTATNVLGDAVGAVLLARWEGGEASPGGSEAPAGG